MADHLIDRLFPPDERTPFIHLTRHFFKRFFDIETISDEAGAHLDVLQVVTILAVLGPFYACFRYFLYSIVSWNYSPAVYASLTLTDQCLYVFFSMAVIGVVAVLEWDRLFPDGWDYAILMPLPVNIQNIFCAKIAALLLFMGLFVLAIAGFPTLFYPVIEVGGTLREGPFSRLAWLIAAHGVAVFSGCLFMFLFFVALQGILINLLSYSQCRKISVYIQGLATVFLVCQFFLLPLIPELLPVWEKARSPLLYALPPMWFLGLYRILLGSHNALFLSLARISVIATAITAMFAAVTYRACFRRYMQTSFEFSQESKLSRFGVSKLAGWLLDRLWIREGPERETFYFVLKTLARNSKHRLYFVGYVAVGLALGLIGILEVMVHSAHGSVWTTISRPDEALLSIPLIVSFFTLIGMRAAFGFPVALPANWIFQVTDESKGGKCLAGARKAMIVLAIVPLFSLTLIVYAVLWGFVASLLTVLFGTLLSLILMELLLYNFHKIPFTCSHLPGKANLPLLGAIYWLAFAFYAYSMASLETWMFHEPVAWIVVLGMELIALNRIMTYRKRSLAEGPGVEYEDAPVSAVLKLDLND